jgi:hypothetical protein
MARAETPQNIQDDEIHHLLTQALSIPPNVWHTLRGKRLAPYIRFWKKELARYSVIGLGPAPSTEDLLQVIEHLKEHPNLPKHVLREHLASRIPKQASDMDALLNLVTQLIFMAHSDADDIIPENGFASSRWTAESLEGFVLSWFPFTDHHTWSNPSHILFEATKSDLKARKLKKHLNVQFWPTNNIQDHLLFDRKGQAVYIFHHVAFIKEQLRLTKKLSTGAPARDCLQL